MNFSYFLLLLYSYYFCNLKIIISIIKNICNQKRFERHNNIVKNWLFELVGKQTNSNN